MKISAIALFGSALLGVSAAPGHATSLDAVAGAFWNFTAVNFAAPPADPFDAVILNLDGTRSGEAVAGTFGGLAPAQARTDVLRVTNPSSETISVILAFDYALAFTLGNPPGPIAPGKYDVDLSASVTVTPAGGRSFDLGGLGLLEQVSCTATACTPAELSDRSRGFPEFVDFELAGGAQTELTIVSRASATATAVAVEDSKAPSVPLPLSALLAGSGLAALAGLGWRARRGPRAA